VARSIKGNVCRFMHRRNPPRHRPRVPPPRRQRIRSLHRQAIQRCTRPSWRCCIFFIIRQRRQQTNYTGRGPSLSANYPEIPPKPPSTEHSSSSAHGPVCGSILHHAACHVLQRIYHHLHIHRRVPWLLHFRLGELQCGPGRQRSHARERHGMLWLIMYGDVNGKRKRLSGGS
jgi:hypothetical protein